MRTISIMIIVIFTAGLTLIGIDAIFNKVAKSPKLEIKVEQKVSENLTHEDMMIMITKSSSAMTGEADISQFAKMLDSPYFMVTSYKGTSIEDFGDFRELDSLKPIRYKEIIRLDQQNDSLNKVFKIKFEIAKKKRERELEILNKPIQ